MPSVFSPLFAASHMLKLKKLKLLFEYFYMKGTYLTSLCDVTQG